MCSRSFGDLSWRIADLSLLCFITHSPNLGCIRYRVYLIIRGGCKVSYRGRTRREMTHVQTELSRAVVSFVDKPRDQLFW